MTPTREAVAVAYGLSLTEVARWGTRTVDIFYRAAVNNGWLTPDPTRPEESA
jgi:hypothetical protein